MKTGKVNKERRKIDERREEKREVGNMIDLGKQKGTAGNGSKRRRLEIVELR